MTVFDGKKKIWGGTQGTAFRFLLFVGCVFFSLMFVGCKKENVKVDDKFVSAFVEMRVVEQTYGLESAVGGLARRNILKKYGYTRESFLAVSEKIKADKNFWLPFQNQVIDRIDSLLDPAEFIAKKIAEKEAAKKAKAKK